MASSSRSRKRPARFTLEEEEKEFVLVVFTEDNVRRMVDGENVRKNEKGWESFDTINKKWYPAVILERSSNKEQLQKKLLLLGSGKSKQKKPEKPAEKKNEKKDEKKKAEKRDEKKDEKKKAEKKKDEKKKEKEILKRRDEEILKAMQSFATPAVVAMEIDEDEAWTPRVETHPPVLASSVRQPPTPTLSVRQPPAPAPSVTRPPAPASPVIPASVSSMRRPPAPPPSERQPLAPASVIQPQTASSSKRRPPAPPPSERRPLAPASVIQPQTPSSSVRCPPAIASSVQQPRNTIRHYLSRVEKADCENCKALQARVEKLEKQLAEVHQHHETSIENEDRPRQGEMSSQLAERHHMHELTPGSGVYLYGHTKQEAATKKKASGVANYLLSVFYTHEELLMARGLPGLDAKVVASIVEFTMTKRPDSTPSFLRQALRVKMEGIKYRAQKKAKKDE